MLHIWFQSVSKITKCINLLYYMNITDQAYLRTRRYATKVYPDSSWRRNRSEAYVFFVPLQFIFLIVIYANLLL